MDKLGEGGKRVNTIKNWTRYWDTIQHLRHQFYLTPGPPATAAVPRKMPVLELKEEKKLKPMVIQDIQHIISYTVYHTVESG